MVQIAAIMQVPEMVVEETLVVEKQARARPAIPARKRPSVTCTKRKANNGIVKGLIHIEGPEIKTLYVDAFFQNQGFGAALIEFAKKEFPVSFLWAVEKNVGAIRFYERHDFYPTDVRELEEGTTEYLVKLERKDREQ